MRKARLISTLSILFILLTSACMSRSPISAFYTLSSLNEPPKQESAYNNMAVTIGPIALPAAHDRPQIVTRDEQNKIYFTEIHRWAGPLDEEIASVISANIGLLLGLNRITPFTRENIFDPDYRVAISIIRYDGSLHKDFIFEAAWSIKKIGQSNPLVVRKTFISEPLESNDYTGLVAAQSRAIGALSRQIAEELRGVR